MLFQKETGRIVNYDIFDIFHWYQADSENEALLTDWMENEYQFLYQVRNWKAI